jgi:5'-3' exonuclease
LEPDVILIDYSNIAKATLSKILHDIRSSEQVSTATLLGKIRHINFEFRNTYGELVIACDHTSWRKDFWEGYKWRRSQAARQEVPEDSPNDDRALIISTMHQCLDALKEHSPYRCIHFRGAEGDDIIGILSTLPGRHLVVSADKDMTQLKSDNVDIWHPVNREFVDNGLNFAKHLAVTGDGGDDVPNILSDADTFMVKEKRQRVMNKKRYSTIMDAVTVEDGIAALDHINGITKEQILENYKRNVRLVTLDRDNIPSWVFDTTIQQFELQANKKPNYTMLFGLCRANNYITRAAEFAVKRIEQPNIDLI